LSGRLCSAVGEAEVGTIDPHAVENDGNAPSKCDGRAPHTAPLCNPHRPCLKPRPFPGMGEHRLCRLIEHGPQHGVTAFGDAAVIVDLAGLVSLGRQTGMCAHIPGMHKAVRLINRCSVGQCNNRTNARDCHEPSAYRIGAHHIEEHLVKDRQLLTHHLPDRQQRIDDCGQSGETFNQLADTRFVIPRADNTDLQAELRSVPRMSHSMSSNLRWSSLRLVSSILCS